MKRTIAFILSIFLMVTVLTAGEMSKAEAAGGKPLVGVCMQSMSQSIYVLEAEALEAIFPDCDVQIASCDDDVSTQIQQINTFALLGAELIIIMPTEIEALTDAIQDAHDAGCKILINGATGDSGALDGYYNTCTVSDEYLIGATVGMVAKKWAEQHLDPNGDWETAFLVCTLSDDTINRSNGMKSVLEPYLKNAKGEYVDAMGNVVDEGNRIANPNYSELIASHYKGMEVEQDMAQSNYTTISNVMTQDANARLFLCYNSLASTEGGQYIVDNYSDLENFGFFSAGVMGGEADYMVGSLGYDDGTLSVFRGACEFGGGDVAGELAALAYSVMYGEAGVDYAVQTPQGIGQWWSVDAGWSGDGKAYLANMDIQNAVTVQDFDPVADLKGMKTTIYWNSETGYDQEAVAGLDAGGPEIAGSEAVAYDFAEGPVSAGTYTCDELTPFGFTVNWTVDLKEDGSYEILEGNPQMGNKIYTGAVWADNGDGTFTTGPMDGSARPMAGWFDADGTGHWGNLGDGIVVGIEEGGSAGDLLADSFPGGMDVGGEAANYQDGEYVIYENTAYGSFDSQTFNAKYKDTGTVLPVLVVVPGGAFRFVENGHLQDFYDSFVDDGYLVVQFNYSTGAGTYPNAIFDIKAGIQYVVDHAEELHADTDNITLLGCSAGGYLVSMAAFTSDDAFAMGSYTYQVRNLVDFFGATQWMTESYLAGPGSPEMEWINADIASMAEDLNPINYLDTTDVTRIWISHGTADITVDIGQSEQFFAGCISALGEESVHFEMVEGAAHEGEAFYTPENFALVKAFISQ